MPTYAEVEHTYRQLIHQSEIELRSVQRTIRYISLIRLLLFAGIILAAIFLWESPRWLYWAAILLPAACFLWLVKRHNRWFHRRDYLKKKIEINHQELQALQGDISSFDDGREYTDPAHLYTYDLDVFGPHSLFQCLHRTSTPIGKQQLAAWLRDALTDRSQILLRQQAVQELTPLLTFRQHFRLLGLLHGGEAGDKDEIARWIASPLRFRGKKLFLVLPYIVLGINLLCIGSALVGTLPSSIAGVVFCLFIFLSFLFTGTITKLQQTYGKKLQILSTYAGQLMEVERLDAQSAALKQLQSSLSRGSKEQSASQVLGRLVTLMNSLDRRNNVFMLMLLNGLFFWELWQMLRIERWKEQHAALLPGWLEAVGQMDAYCSLATFAYNHPHYIYPELSAAPFCFEATALGHPLMDRAKCVCNDIHIPLKPYFLIVTGANMAGKSTYLRTVGVNFLLACIGAPVWAQQMTLSPVRLVTSLRTTDSLTDNESYFFAELKRLQRIVQKLEAGEELFIILDEILKGTNSVDKQKGSLSLIRRFMQLQATGIIATHDLVLGSLSEVFPSHIRNYCFEADITNNELTFSYRMREGIAQNMNACFLMEKMGLFN